MWSVPELLGLGSVLGSSCSPRQNAEPLISRNVDSSKQGNKGKTNTKLAPRNLQCTDTCFVCSPWVQVTWTRWPASGPMTKGYITSNRIARTWQSWNKSHCSWEETENEKRKKWNQIKQARLVYKYLQLILGPGRFNYHPGRRARSRD